MNLPIDPTQNTTSNPEQAKELRGSVSRRQLLKLGAAGGTVTVLSVASRSVFATGTLNGCATTPSAFGSINLSRPDVCTQTSGRSHGYWKNPQHFSDWPSGYYPTAAPPPGPSATLFHDVFAGSAGSAFTGKTLLEVLEMGGGGATAVARDVSTAVLNAADGKTLGILTVDQVKTIWLDYITPGKGYFEPTAGIKWYADYSDPPTPSSPGGIIGYLKTTWT